MSEKIMQEAVDQQNEEPVSQVSEPNCFSSNIVDKIYRLRKNFLILGLTGRTGSGCTTVADTLTKNFNQLKSRYRDFHRGDIDNNTRKDRIIYKYLEQNWKTPFTKITASDIIFYFALTLEFDEFISSIVEASKVKLHNNGGYSEDINSLLEQLADIKNEYNRIHVEICKIDPQLDNNKAEEFDDAFMQTFKQIIWEDIPRFRVQLRRSMKNPTMIDMGLQQWGNNIRLYNSIKKSETLDKRAPSCLAHKINCMIKALRAHNKKNGEPTLIVIDALRNPFEVLYFRERYSAFYLLSVNTTEEIRHQKLFEKGFRKDEIEKIDEGEKTNDEKDLSEIENRYQYIDIDSCIEHSDIFLTHDGTNAEKNYDLVNQIFTYVALIFHPGLVPPSSLERIMQVAYTAKLNSGCLSRQVGAAVTNSSYSVQSIGWNTVAEGQTPCSIRSLYDLFSHEDDNAFSNFEKNHQEFNKFIVRLVEKYRKKDCEKKLNGLTLTYCFKDIYTTINAEKQRGNQVHTRSLHAEENAFLQLAKYGTQGILGGKLFTTASCCELCAKKAYQLGIKEIYYIDAYPGISKTHILECGDRRPEMILFHGVIGRAYVSLYNPMLPLKDEIETLTHVKVKKLGTENKTNDQYKNN